MWACIKKQKCNQCRRSIWESLNKNRQTKKSWPTTVAELVYILNVCSKQKLHKSGDISAQFCRCVNISFVNLSTFTYFSLSHLKSVRLLLATLFAMNPFIFSVSYYSKRIVCFEFGQFIRLSHNGAELEHPQIIDFSSNGQAVMEYWNWSNALFRLTFTFFCWFIPSKYTKQNSCMNCHAILTWTGNIPQ